MLKKIKKTNGDVIVEASIVFPIVIMVVFTLMYVGLVLYQQTNMRVIANKTAESIGRVYSSPSKDPFVGFIEPKDFSKTKLYRHLQNAVGNALGSANTVDSLNQLKGRQYAKYCFLTSRLYNPIGNVDANVDFSYKAGAPFQKVVTVTLKAVYDIPFLRFFGIRNSQKQFVAHGKAQCMDLLEYGSVLSLSDLLLRDVDNMAGVIVDPIRDAEHIVGWIREFMDKFPLS